MRTLPVLPSKYSSFVFERGRAVDPEGVVAAEAVGVHHQLAEEEEVEEFLLEPIGQGREL